MDVYTNPPSNTYILNTRFTFPTSGGGVSAIAIKSTWFPILIAAYSILIQLIFASLWQFCANTIIFLYAVYSRNADRARYVGLVAFWNSGDPWTATINMSHYVWQVWVNGGGRVSRQDKVKGLLLFIISVLIAGGSVATSILVPNAMPLGSAAPVHPAAVLPLMGEISNASTIRINKLYAPAVLRALGSTEAFSDVTARKNIAIQRTSLLESNHTHPSLQIDYAYTINASGFGLQSPSSFSHTVQGQCHTEYGWLHPASNSTSPGINTTMWNEYRPWNMNDIPTYLDPTDINMEPNFDLSIGVISGPDMLDRQVANRSFALVPLLAHATSITSSSDPWYLTEQTNGPFGGGYRIKSGRPALSCWEESLFCVEGLCTSLSQLNRTHLPKGIRRTLSKFAVPVIVDMIASAGKAALKSTAGAGPSALLDCGSSMAIDDIDRLVLAAYLSSREVFRETALMGRQSGFVNGLLASDGELLPGAANFVMVSGDVVAVCYSLLVSVPAVCLVTCLIAGMLPLGRRGIDVGGDGLAPSSVRDKYLAFCEALRATQLYRMVDESRGTNGWNKRRSIIPLPPARKETTCGTAIPYFEDRHTVNLGTPGNVQCRPSIRRYPINSRKSILRYTRLDNDNETTSRLTTRANENHASLQQYNRLD